MSTIEKNLYIQQADGTIKEYVICFQDSGDTAIIMNLNEEGRKIFKNEDLFSSLNLIRAYFEAKNAKVLCKGSRVDVHPSGMSRGMARGRKAYIIKLGKQARMSDLVDIFEYDDSDKIASINEQNQYYKQWVDSLG